MPEASWSNILVNFFAIFFLQNCELFSKFCGVQNCKVRLANGISLDNDVRDSTRNSKRRTKRQPIQFEKD